MCTNQSVLSNCFPTCALLTFNQPNRRLLVLCHSHNRCFFKSSLREKNPKEVFNENLGLSLRLTFLAKQGKRALLRSNDHFTVFYDPNDCAFRVQLQETYNLARNGGLMTLRYLSYLNYFLQLINLIAIFIYLTHLFCSRFYLIFSLESHIFTVFNDYF